MRGGGGGEGIQNYKTGCGTIGGGGAAPSTEAYETEEEEGVSVMSSPMDWVVEGGVGAGGGGGGCGFSDVDVDCSSVKDDLYHAAAAPSLPCPPCASFE